MFDQKHIDRIKAPQSLPGFVYKAIKEAITTGRIPSGARLKQLEIAAELKVSQQTVREALTSLAATGLVEQVIHRGFEVTRIPPWEQEEIYRLRAALEIHALEEVMEKFTAADLAAMRKLIPQTATTDASIPLDHTRRVNRAFHMFPVWKSHNRHLIRILDQLWDILSVCCYSEGINNRSLSAARELEEHHGIVDALQKKDMAAIRKAVTHHILVPFLKTGSQA